MAFKRGKDYRVFITTENNTGSVVYTTAGLSATTSSGYGPNAATLKGVGKLGEMTGQMYADGEIKNIEGIEPTWAYEDDPMTVFGQARPLDNPIRKKWEFTVTRLGEDNLFGKLAEGGRFGVTGTAPALFDGLSTMPDTTGYRIYLYTGNDFYVGYQGTIKADGFKETLTPTGVSRQAVTFAGGNWSASVQSGTAGITGSMAITQ
jgi:hypothetical protein